MVRRGKLFVLSAASGGGKTTLKDRLLEEFPQIKYSISATTRDPRPGEKDGVHYYFYSREKFLKLVEQKEFVEYNEVHGNLYGTPKKPIEDNLEKGLSLILDLDVYGKKNFDVVFPNAVGIFIEPPSLQELERRLRHRKSDSEETVQLRMENAIREMDFAHKEGKYEYQIINADLEKAYAELRDIILKELDS